MPQSSSNAPFHRRVVDSPMGRFGSRIAATSWGQTGITGAAFTLGIGKEGLFHPSTLAISSVGFQGGISGFGTAFKTATPMARAGIIGGAGLRALGPGFAIFDAIRGYREGGVLGAGKSLATNMAFGAIGNIALKAIGSAGGGAITYGLPLAVVAAAGYGTYKALQFGNSVVKKQRRLEMGSPIVDPFGTAATMRARSLQALQNSQFNGRSAFGSEASLLAIPYMR